MPLDDSTWVIRSLPHGRLDAPDPAPEVILHAFRSELSPWRVDERPEPSVRTRGADGAGPRGTARAAG
jgi:hypothetical protein